MLSVCLVVRTRNYAIENEMFEHNNATQPKYLNVKVLRVRVKGNLYHKQIFVSIPCTPSIDRESANCGWGIAYGRGI